MAAGLVCIPIACQGRWIKACAKRRDWRLHTPRTFSKKLQEPELDLQQRMICEPRAGNQSWKGRGPQGENTGASSRGSASLSPGGRKGHSSRGKPTECRTHLNTTRENFKGKVFSKYLFPSNREQLAPGRAEVLSVI